MKYILAIKILDFLYETNPTWIPQRNDWTFLDHRHQLAELVAFLPHCVTKRHNDGDMNACCEYVKVDLRVLGDVAQVKLTELGECVKYRNCMHNCTHDLNEFSK